MYKINTLEDHHRAIHFMEKNLFEKLCVRDIAQYCMLSASGLEKIFQKHEKKGVKRYFLDMKLDYAAKMLKEGYTVNYLARLLNFSSTSHLSIAFKKKYGMSPLKYKYPLVEKSEELSAGV